MAARPESSAHVPHKAYVAAAIENAPYGFDIVDHTATLIYVNNAYLRMWGYEHAAEVVGMSPIHHCVDPEVPARIIAGLREHGVFETEFKARRKDGSTFDVRMYSYLGHAPDGSEVYYGTSIDVSDQKEYIATLERLSSQKESLLREVYHRTKNTMQLILSMLHTRAASYAEDSTAAELALDIESRVMAMALVHDQVYQAEDLANISLDSYVHNLVEFLVSGTKPVGLDVTVDYSMTNTVVGIDTAISCGLVVNELVRNALEHAFDEPGAGALSILLETTDAGSVVISVLDDGCGAPPGFSIETDASLGLQTAASLVEGQLGGRLELVDAAGFGVRFSIQP